MVALLLALLATQPPQRTPAPPRDATATTTSGTAVMRGRVLAADTKKPLRRARVTLTAPELGRETRETSTNLDGRWQIKDLPSGRYTLSVQRAGYLSLRYGQRRPLEPAKPLQIVDKQTIENLDFALPRMSVITGRVFDETSDPVSGAQIFAMRVMWFEGRRRLVPMSSSTQSDDAGQFRLAGLRPGTYYVRANLRETWTADAGGTEQTFGYAPTFHPNAVDLSGARRVVVGVGQETGNADVFLIPGRTVTVSGSAFDSRGRPIVGQVGLNVETRGPEGGSYSGAASARVNPDGTFAIKNVVPGDYIIRTTTQGDGAAEVITLPLTVRDADIDNITLTARPPWSVSGRVVSEDGATPSFSPDRARVTARIVDGDLNARTGAFNPDSGRVKDDWSFTVTNNYAASYLRLTLPDGWALRGILDRDGRDITDEPIERRAGEEMSDLRVVVTSAVTKLSGRLTDEKGGPVPDGTVLVFADEAGRWSEDSRFVRSARLDQQGQFEIKGLPPAAYLAVALDYVEDGMWNDPEFLESLRQSATKLALAEGEARTVALKLTTVAQ